MGIHKLDFYVYGYSFEEPIFFKEAGKAFDSPPVMLGNPGMIGFAISGFLVGFGTKLGNGCTSGHGVCGLPRLSSRSIIAVCCFMTTGVITASIK